MGVGSKGSPTYSSGRLLANVEKLGGDVSLSTIGRLGGHVSTKVQRVTSSDPKETAKKYWAALKAHADKEVALSNVSGGWRVEFGKHSHVTYRPKSSSKDESPSITINDKGPNWFIYKIHFVKPRSEKN